VRHQYALGIRDTKPAAYELIDRWLPAKSPPLSVCLKSWLDPCRSLANAPYEDEAISEEETRAVAASKEWLKDHEPIPMKEVLAESDSPKRTSTAWDELHSSLHGAGQYIMTRESPGLTKASPTSAPIDRLQPPHPAPP